MPAPPGNKFAQGNNGGRPSTYDPSFADQAAKLCALGATDIELADFFGVNTVTIYAWRNTHEEFAKAVSAGKELADERVERSLFNRAVGYTFESEKVFQYQGEIVRAQTREHVPPDPGAAMNWLKNRRPEQWREKQTVEHEGKLQVGADDALARLFDALDHATARKLRGGTSESGVD